MFVKRIARLNQPLLRTVASRNKLSVPEFVEKEIPSKKFSVRKTVSFLWPYIMPADNRLRVTMLSTVGLLVLSKGINAGVPFILKEGVNSLATHHPNFTYAALLMGSYAGARAAMILFQELRNAMFSRIVLNAVKDVSNQLFWHLQSLDYTFHQQSTKTTLFAVGRSMKGVENFLKFMMQHILPTTLEFGLAAGIMMTYCGWPYMLTLAGTVSVYSVFTTRYSKVRQNYLKEMRQKNKAVDFVINESFINFETVKCFTNEKLESERYNHNLSSQIKAAIHTAESLTKLNMGQQLIFNTGLGINLLLAVSQLKAGTMTVGDIFMIQTLFLQLQFPLNFLGTVYRELNESQLEMRDLFHLLSIKPSVQELPDAKPFEYKGGRIKLSNVNYRPSTERITFNNLNLEFEPGSTNAIVGESGIGKSTLFRLLFRLFDTKSGEIFLDGQEIKSLQIKSLRDTMALVPQSGHLFNDSIYYNISYGRPEATMEEIIEVSKKVNLYNRIMEFPEGFNTQVGELGGKLSGGERQRLTLARCLLKDAKFYFLDEVTSAMDSYNEEMISRVLRKELEGKTVVYAAHRLSSITHVDKIFVLADGKVAETGSHSELLSDPNSKYSALWTKFLSQHD